MPTKSIAVRLPDELLEYLTKRAEKEHRTLSNMIISILLTEQGHGYVVNAKKQSTVELKKCKYHCDYGDGEYCHFTGESGCANY